MTTIQIIGLALIAMPFLVILYGCLRTVGMAGTLIVFGSTAAVVLTICAGSYLLTGGK